MGIDFTNIGLGILSFLLHFIEPAIFLGIMYYVLKKNNLLPVIQKAFKDFKRDTSPHKKKFWDNVQKELNTLNTKGGQKGKNSVKSNPFFTTLNSQFNPPSAPVHNPLVEPGESASFYATPTSSVHGSSQKDHEARMKRFHKASKR